MAKETILRLTDDLDGSEAEESLQFALRGREYEIDLNAKNIAGIEKALAKYIAASRRVSGSRSRPRGPARRGGSGGGNAGGIRTWARERGYAVSDRGRIPAEIRQAYEASSD